MFKFSENILKLSSSSDIDEAIKEWLFIDEGQTKEAENTCICQKKIKNFNYMYNYKTKKTILVGSSCFKKFNFSEREIKNSLLKTVLQLSVRSGEYEAISDVMEYSNMILRKLKEFVIQKFQNIKNSKHERNKLLNEIENLINEYELEELKDILEQVKQECEILDLIEDDKTRNKEAIRIPDQTENKKKCVRCYDYIGNGYTIGGYYRCKSCTMFLQATGEIPFIR
jgi:predicted house-cleaning noncanonical NTP pyrophosphatase (MazG superfamily)